MTAKKVTIVGAGVIGLCTAFYCRRRGFEVTVIDRRPASRDGCSFGNAGMIVPSHFIPLAAPGMVKLGLKWMWNPRSPFYIKPRLSWDLLAWGVQFWRSANRRHVERAAPVLRDLHLLSRNLYEELAAEPGADFGFTPRGLLMLCKTAAALAEESHAADHARRLGIPADVLDPAAIAKLEPGVQMDVAGGVYFPRDAHLSPAALMAWLERTLADDGVRFEWNTDVAGFNSNDGRVTTVCLSGDTSADGKRPGPASSSSALSPSSADAELELGGPGHSRRCSPHEIPTDHLVLAGGIWSSAIGRDLGLHLPMQAGKGYSMTLPSPRHQLSICAILTEARIAVTPMGNTLRFGGTMEMAGLDESITAERVEGIVEAIPRYYPAYRADDFAGLPTWHGLRPCAPDGMPYLGRSAKQANVVVATGHAMMGVSLAPATGKIVADLLAGDAPTVDLALMSPERFG